MLNPKFIGLDLFCLATCMPNYLLDISTWRKLRYQQLHMFESKLTLSMIFHLWHHHPLWVPQPPSHLLYTSNQQISPDPLISLHVPCHYSSFEAIIFHQDNFGSCLQQASCLQCCLGPLVPRFLPTDSINPLLKNVRWWYLALKIMTELFNNPPRLCMNWPLLLYPALSPDYPQACWSFCKFLESSLSPLGFHSRLLFLWVTLPSGFLYPTP